MWYVGGLITGKRAGLGVQEWVDKTRFVGEWFEDNMSGLGRQTYPDGGMYLGQFQNGKREGLGKYVDPSGKVYQGSWVNNKRHGNAMERSHAKVVSGTVFREFIVEYLEDELIAKKLMVRGADWIQEVKKQADAAQKLFLYISDYYGNLLE